MDLAIGFDAKASEYSSSYARTLRQTKGSLFVYQTWRVSRLSEQAALANEVGSQINKVLSDPVVVARYQKGPADDPSAPNDVVRIAHETVSSRVPDMPEAAQWVLTADLLNSLNWPSLASKALRSAEEASPTVTKIPGVQYLAGMVAAESGEH